MTTSWAAGSRKRRPDAWDDLLHESNRDADRAERLVRQDRENQAAWDARLRQESLEEEHQRAHELELVQFDAEELAERSAAESEDDELAAIFNEMTVADNAALEGEENAFVSISDSAPRPDRETHLQRPSAIVQEAGFTVAVMEESAGASLAGGASPTTAFSGPMVLATSPEEGACFAGGSRDFTAVDALLRGNRPATWQGDARQAYSAASETLTTLVQQMAALDLQMRAIVHEHATYVAYAQRGLGAALEALIVTYALVCYLENNGSISLAYAIAIALSAAAINVGLGLLSNCFAHSRHTAETTKQIAYHEISRAAQRVSTARLRRDARA